jgi:emp24/gp25L/p24 family/GOLD
MFVLFFLLALGQCLIFKIESMKSPFVIEKTVPENQICTGKFGIARPTNAVLAIKIYSQDNRRVFNKEDIRHGDQPVNLSFNTSVGQVYTIRVSAQEQPQNHEPVYLQYGLSSQINTFDKDVAKASVLDPAFEEVSKFENLLYESTRQTAARQRETRSLTESFKQIVLTIFLTNFVIFAAFAGITAVHLVAFQSFLRKKKLI